MANEDYAWERTYERKWEELTEDESGLLRAAAIVGGGAARRPAADGALASHRASLQRGMMRNLFLVLDFSRAMEQTDLKPSRLVAVCAAASEFIAEYFDANPLSQLGLIVMHSALAEKLTDLGGNPKGHIAAAAAAMRRAGPGSGGGGGIGSGSAAPLAAAAQRAFGGDMSLQNALDAACRTLALQPKFGSREVLLIHGALATRDPGDIGETIADLRCEHVRVSIVSLPGEVFIAQRVARETGGSYGVPESYDALRRLVLAHTQPPPRRLDQADPEAQRMVRVGFPELVEEQGGLCNCHRELLPRAFVCPSCSTRTCEIPSACAVCGLHLVAAPALARSYHHLFPVPRFDDVLPTAAAATAAVAAAAALPHAPAAVEGLDGAMSVDDALPAVASPQASAAGEVASLRSCRGCLEPLAGQDSYFECPSCSLVFCTACDELLHDSIHTCPGCV